VPQLRQQLEKYAQKGLLVVTVNIDKDPRGVPQFVREKQVADMPILLSLGNPSVQQAYRLDGPHHTYLIDQRGVVRAHQRGAVNDNRFEQKIELVLGMTPPEFGWLPSVASDYQKAVEDIGAGRLDQALGKLKSIAPPSVMMIKVDVSALPPQYVRTCLQATQAGAQQWQGVIQRAWGKVVQFQFVLDDEKKAEGDDKDKKDEKKDEKKIEDKRADLIIKFATQVIDPTDNAQILTTCADTRTLNEGEMGMRPSAGEERKPRHTLAKIAVGHASAGAHTPQALVHLVEMSIAYAMGMNNRDDNDSITKVNVDDDRPTVSPSAEDMMVLGNLLFNVHFQMGNVYLKQKKFKEAEEEFKIALAVNRSEPRATQGLKEARQQQVASAGSQ
jgi:hypothetical protein